METITLEEILFKLRLKEKYTRQRGKLHRKSLKTDETACGKAQFLKSVGKFEELKADSQYGWTEKKKVSTETVGAGLCIAF